MGESVAEGAARELMEESCLNIIWWNFWSVVSPYYRWILSLVFFLTFPFLAKSWTTPVRDIEVTSVKNILFGGREEGVCYQINRSHYHI